MNFAEAASRRFAGAAAVALVHVLVYLLNISAEWLLQEYSVQHRYKRLLKHAGRSAAGKQANLKHIVTPAALALTLILALIALSISSTAS
jgi:hypothetical protein